MCNLELDYDIRNHSQDIGLRTYFQSQPRLNMNIDGNIESHTMTSLMISSWSKWFNLT